MVDESRIRAEMEVLGSDGEHVGTVDHVDGSRIKLTRKDSADGQHHYVPLSSVARVDAHVHLGTTAAAALAGAGAAVAGAKAGGSDHDPFPPVKNRAVAGAAPRGNFWLPWIVGAVGLLLLFLLFRGCVRHTEPAAAPTTTTSTTTTNTAPLPVEAVKLPNGQTVSLAPRTLNYELQRYLASSDLAPRTFTFDKLNFDTASAAIRPDDQPTVDALGQILAAYPKAKVKLIGYTDTQGTAPANAQLGQRRADAVVAALKAKGVEASRLAAASGGEDSPRDTNGTAQGRAQNRRTELEVTAK